MGWQRATCYSGRGTPSTRVGVAGTGGMYVCVTQRWFKGKTQVPVSSLGNWSLIQNFAMRELSWGHSQCVAGWGGMEAPLKSCSVELSVAKSIEKCPPES